ncbi:hypothetical protein CTA1_3000 [Colletotrichum tanaceti]|uniref:BTB domain-containing protein n=1 Tax=Colletotrichum tanaceti TaxID=1306861 RepID=A0A4U6XKA3_9PEZI|nr:hypothetical protein CTA1_3000 [Colletotrichum tanaceti]
MSDVEPATFVNLMEYAYSRDYTIADPSKKKSSSKDKACTYEAEKAGSLYSWILEVSKSPQGQRYRWAQYKFCLENFPIDTTINAPTEAWLKINQLQHDSGYQTVLKTHLNLYFVADQYEITELKDLCLERTLS